jgi:methionyl-tRNA formyltransferase
MKLLNKKLKQVVFIGFSPVIDKLFTINKKKKISSILITSPDQYRILDKKNKELNCKVFRKLDKNFEKFIKKKFDISNTLFISISSRWIFKKKQISFFNNKLVNFHSSRLPYFKGGATFSWQILCGDKIHCNSIHLVNTKIDNGPIIFSKRSIFPSRCKIPLDYQEYDLEQLLKLYESFLSKVINNETFALKNQSEGIGNYFPRLESKKDSWINWELKADEINKFINAFDDPYYGSQTFNTRFKKKILKIKSVHLHEGEISKHPILSGVVIRNDVNWLVVSLGEKNYTLLIEKVLNQENLNIIKKIKSGDRFYTPIKFLDNSKRIRSKFGASGRVL